jgi:hypothetical protein
MRKRKKQERFKILKTGYKFDRLIFKIGLVVMVLLFFSAWLTEGGGFLDKRFYMKCPENTPKCLNPLYGQCDEYYCQNEYLMPGDEIGSKPGWFFRNFLVIMIVVLIFTFGINHYKHNKDYFKNVEAI